MRFSSAYSLLLCACTSVVSLPSAVPEGEAVAEPRLLGDWVVVDGTDTTRVSVTQDAAASYLIRTSTSNGDSTEVIGELGPLRGDLWVLDLSPGGQVQQSLNEYGSMIAPLHIQLIVRRRPAGVDFAVIDMDSLAAAVKSARGRHRRPAVRTCS